MIAGTNNLNPAQERIVTQFEPLVYRFRRVANQVQPHKSTSCFAALSVL